MKDIREKIDQIKKQKRKVCIFGAGKMGTGFWYSMLQELQIGVDYFCDNDSKKWGEEIKDGIKCISPEELAKKKECACFVLAGIFKMNIIREQLYDMGMEMVIVFSDLYMLAEVTDIFYNTSFTYDESIYRKRLEILEKGKEKGKRIENPRNKKIAVYTCVTGNYDEAIEPEYVSENCDYYFISDEKPKELEIYKWIAASDVVPDWVTDNVRRNRYCKINGCMLFEDYPYSIYIDGSLKIIKNIDDYIGKIGMSGIAMHPHLLYPNMGVYQEGIQCVACQLDDENLIRWQMENYRKENMPENFGMFECGVIVRDHGNKICQEIMQRWWKEVFTRSYRDQLSFTYCLWKSGMRADAVGTIGKGRLSGVEEEIITIYHHH